MSPPPDPAYRFCPRCAGMLAPRRLKPDEPEWVTYMARAVQGAPTAGDECSEVRLFAPADIPWDELAFDNTRLALCDYRRRFSRARPGRLKMKM